LNFINKDKIKVVSFDAFNTLFDAKTYHIDACNIILKKLGALDINVIEFHQDWDLFITEGWKKLNDIDQGFLSQKDFFLKTTEQLFEKYNLKGNPEEALQIWYNLLNGIELFDEVPEVITEIKKKGYITIILSNIDNDFLFDLLDRFNLKNKFDHIFTSEDLRSYKPNAVIFKKVLLALQLDGNEIVHIGDSQIADVLGAKNSGFKVIYINRKNKSLKKSIPYPDLIISNLREILNYL